MISHWEHHILSIKACHATRPVLNCFISMTISVESCCGFQPLVSCFAVADFSFSPFFRGGGGQTGLERREGKKGEQKIRRGQEKGPDLWGGGGGGW